MLKGSRITYGIFLIMSILFLLIVSKGLAAPQPGDENTYYYMGKLVTEGKIPYRDFFYAHPPLHIYILALFYNIFGFNIIALKSIPLLSTLASSFFIFKITQAKFGNAEALASSALFMFSYSVMFNSVFSFGTDVAVLLLAVGLYFLLVKESYLFAGAFFGAAASARLLSLIPVLTILGLVAFSNKRNFIKLSSAFLLVFLLFSGTFIFFAGKAYLKQAYLFHLLKSPGIKENAREYFDIIKLNWILFASASLFLFAGKRAKSGCSLWHHALTSYFCCYLGKSSAFIS
ncbi:glycosyltransferase family 39 protein [Candidatus Woesearchaeota archaeon]|nr:glycosyltransferase family 39 protein [Candidatus Woesearchaeota archaeon]